LPRRRSKVGGTRSQSPESGQALLELALVTPLLILLVVAIFEFAFVLETQIGLTNAVREAARRAAATSNPTDAWVQGQLCGADLVACDTGLLHDNVQAFSGSRLVGTTVTFCNYTVGAISNYGVIVKITYRHPVFFGPIAFATDAIDGTADGAWELSADAQMRLERGQPVPAPSTACPS
jgi:hypothetical protein